MKTKNLEAQIDELAALNYTIVLRYDDEGDVVASVKELDGCIAHGQDAMKALDNLESMKKLWIESCLKDGGVVPLPAEEEDDLPSGKWLQRAPKTLHRKLIEVAKNEGVSLNGFVTSCLAEAVGNRLARAGVSPHVGIIDTIRGRGASGANYFGCWKFGTIESFPAEPETEAIYENKNDFYGSVLIQHLAPSIPQIPERHRRDDKESSRSLAYQA